MKKWDAFRFTLVLFFFLFSYFLVIIKLFYWQVVRASDLRKIGEEQSTESLIVKAKRGEILTGDNFPLATNKITYLVYANPKLIKDKDYYATKLADALSLSVASVAAKLSQNLYWVRLESKVEQDTKQKVEKLNLKGVGFQQESDRYYPEASMAAHLIGFLGKDTEGEGKGYFGLEGFYNEQLKGRDGKLYVVRDALGTPLINDIREQDKIDGRSLVTNIDRTIQYYAQKELLNGVNTYDANGGSVIVMEPSTGKVLAMASFPSFDPQNYYDFDSTSYKNPAISSVYEPGSTFKVLVMSSGLDLDLVKPDTKCDICSGSIKVGEYNIKTWNDKYYPNTTMTEVIQHSDNTGMVFVAKKLGIDKMISYLTKFGINDNTGVDLQGETSGTIRARNSWYQVDLATSSFGQGISITPMQLISAVSSIANGGKMMKPYVVSKIIKEDGNVIDIKPEEKGRVIKESTAKVMTYIMVNAVEKGEAQWTKLSDYKVAGKTGTAQIPVAGHYDPNKTIASFVGFFPADNPKISMLVLIDRPKKSIYGAETAAPIFFNIAREIINYYNIRPTY